MLVVEAERWATTLDASAVVVRSNVAREESHHFYPALGYARTKTQHVYMKHLRSSSAKPAESLQSSSTPRATSLLRCLPFPILLPRRDRVGVDEDFSRRRS